VQGRILNCTVCRRHICTQFLQGRILNCTVCRKHICTQFRTCQMLWPVCVKTHHTLGTLGNTARKLPWVQTTVVGILEQMKGIQMKSVDEHYTEGKPKCTEVSKQSCWIQTIRQQNSLFDITQYYWIRTMFHDSIPPSFSVGQNYVQVDIEVIPRKQ